MRPTIDEILDGVERSFRRDLQPELKSEWAARIGAALLQAIGHVRLRLALDRELLEQEHADLTAVLGLLGAGSPPEPPVPVRALSDEELEAATLARRDELDRIIRDGSLVPQPGDLRWQAVTGYTERQLDREARLIPR